MTDPGNTVEGLEATLDTLLTRGWTAGMMYNSRGQYCLVGAVLYSVDSEDQPDVIGALYEALPKSERHHYVNPAKTLTTNKATALTDFNDGHNLSFRVKRLIYRAIKNERAKIRQAEKERKQVEERAIAQLRAMMTIPNPIDPGPVGPGPDPHPIDPGPSPQPEPEVPDEAKAIVTTGRK